MKTLIIDTISQRLYCILLDDMAKLDSQTENGLQHSARLNQSIDLLLCRNNLTLNDIDCFALNIGTGSFTGIRIGIATVKGFLTALPNKRVVTFTTLHAAAYSDMENACLMDAGRDLFYYARYENIRCIERERLIDKSEAQKFIAQGATVWDNQTDYTDCLCALVRDKISNGEFADNLSPIYLRQPQAVEELNKKCK